MNLFLADGTTAVSANSILSAAEFAGLTYKTIANENGSGLISFDVIDSGDFISPNSNVLASESVRITVNGENDAPQQLSAGVITSVSEDSANSSAVALWSTAPAYSTGGGSDEESQALTYMITSIPAFVNLFLADGTTAVSANSILSAAEFAGLTYKTIANASGSSSISFDVFDSGLSGSPDSNLLTDESVSIAVVSQNWAVQFDWGSTSRFVSQETGSQLPAVLVDLGTLFSEPGLGDGTTVTTGLNWELDLPSPLKGLIELDQANGTLLWKNATSLDVDLAGSYSILVSAFNGHYLLGNGTAIAHGVIQLEVKLPGSPPSIIEDLVVRLQDLPSVNGSSSWTLFQPTDANSSVKNVLATSETLIGSLTFLSPDLAVAALPTGFTLSNTSARSGFDPISYSLTTDQPGGWYSIADFAIPQQPAAGLIVMKGYDADHANTTTELAYQQYHSSFLSFDDASQVKYGGDLAGWLRDQRFSVSAYQSDLALLQVSEAQLQDTDFAALTLQSLPTEKVALGTRVAADGSALLIDSDGDGMVDYVRLLLIDNGLFDLGPTSGVVSDPMALLSVVRQEGASHLLPAVQQVAAAQQADDHSFELFAWNLWQRSETSTNTSVILGATSSYQGPSALAATTQSPAPGLGGVVGVELRDDDRRGEDSASIALDAPNIFRVEKMDELLTIDVRVVVEESKETIETFADSVKESLVKLMPNSDMVSSRFLAGLLLPAGGTSIVEQLLGKMSPGGNHRLAQRDRDLRGRWRLGLGRRVLTLAEGRVRLTRQDDPIATVSLEGFPAGDDPSLALLASGRLLELVRRSPEPGQALAMVQGQLHNLLAGTMPVTWSAWLQALPVALAYPSRLQSWRARTSLKHLQNELAQLGTIDPALMDVVMAAELVTCLEAFEIDLLSETDLGEALPAVQRVASMAST